MREQSEKYKSEILLIKNQSESGTASIRLELESAKAEIARLTQLIESMRIELEKIRKDNSEVNFDLCFLLLFDEKKFIIIIAHCNSPTNWWLRVPHQISHGGG